MPNVSRQGLRLLGAATSLMLCFAGPAVSDEVPYLMYIKGSEGPPASPIRVLWNVRDGTSADITIDLGEKHEGALGKLGLARVVKYDAQLEKTRFVARAPELTRFVRTIAVSIVQGLLQASVGAWAQKPDAEVRMAELHITPEARPPQLEIVTWLHVTYQAPQKSGRAKVTDLIKGDLIFVGKPE
jgi:hypothetical protein